VDKPLKSVMHGQCNARPMVTPQDAGHHCHLTSVKFYCLVTEAHICKQLAEICYLKAEQPRLKHAHHKSNALTTMPPGHTQINSQCLILTMNQYGGSQGHNTYCYAILHAGLHTHWLGITVQKLQKNSQLTKMSKNGIIKTVTIKKIIQLMQKITIMSVCSRYGSAFASTQISLMIS